MSYSPEQMERGLRRLERDLDLYVPLLTAIKEAHYAMREARFILLGSGGSLLERSERTAAFLEVAAARVLERFQEDEDADQLKLEEDAS